MRATGRSHLHLLALSGALLAACGDSNQPQITAFSAAPASIAPGGTSTLSWSVKDAKTLTLDQGIGEVIGTSVDVKPAATTTYTLTAAYGAKRATRSITVVVEVPGAPAIASFTATPSSIASGQSSTLSWSVSGATSLSIDPGVGVVTGTSVEVSPEATTTYTLTATNAAGSATRSVAVVVEVPGAPVIASFTATPSSIASGQSSTLSWSVSGATSLSIDPGVGAVTGTSVEVSPEETTTYTLTATSAEGSSTRSVTVVVEVPGAPVIASFNATPSSIASGQSSTLSWSVSGATSLSIDQGVGAVTGTSVAVTPAATTTYTLTATNDAGSVTAQATVTVAAPGAPSIAWFYASPGSIAPGQSSTLSWSVSGATSLSIDQGVGAVTGSSVAVTPAGTTTYTLTATNTYGSVTRQATVEVGTAPVIASFTAAPSSIAAGQSSTLSWSVSGATSLSIDQGVGTVTGTSVAVSPKATMVYTLTASSSFGTSTKQVTVEVQGSGAVVISSFTAASPTITPGQSSTLSWNVTGATSISLDQGIGVVTGTSRAVSPAATTVYTLTASSATSSATRQVTVNVALAGAPVISSFTAAPATVAFGQSATLSWTVTGATWVRVSPYYSNYCDASDASKTTCTVTPPGTTTYVLDAGNSVANVSERVTVTMSLAATPRLYTKGNKIHVSNGGADPVWVGRGVNLDDVFLSGYTDIWAEEALKGLHAELIQGWRPTFVRFALNMNGRRRVSWLSEPEMYRTPMANVINAIGAHLGVYALVTLQSDATMTYCDQEQTICMPTADTDAVYRALVDTFKDASFVMFGVSNEPGGMAASNQEIVAAMGHAVGVIRAREDELGVPHHIVAVQGNTWSSDLSFYDQSPLPYDDVVYEYHAFPPTSSGYTFPHIPVIIGAYGPPVTSDLPEAADLFWDLETKQIPSLAWIFSDFNSGRPNLLRPSFGGRFDPSPWGHTVEDYLLYPADYGP